MLQAGAPLVFFKKQIIGNYSSTYIYKFRTSFQLLGGTREPGHVTYHSYGINPAFCQPVEQDGNTFPNEVMLREGALLKGSSTSIII